MMLPKRILNSLYERARFFAQNVFVERQLSENNIPGTWSWSPDLLQTLLSIRSLVPVIPDVLIDVGAHRGDFAAAADRVLGFKHIVCVEPDLDLIDELQANLPNGKSRVHAVALSEHDGNALLHVHADRSMNSIIEADANILREQFPTYRHDTVFERRVTTRTLDSIVGDSDECAGKSLFLKLDTQGNELNILRGGENALRNTVACLVEFMFCTPYATDYNFRDVIELFFENDFECRGALSVRRRPSHKISAVDFLLVRNLA
jgi:FkbM family methyltransferase